MEALTSQSHSQFVICHFSAFSTWKILVFCDQSRFGNGLPPTSTPQDFFCLSLKRILPLKTGNIAWIRCEYMNQGLANLPWMWVGKRWRHTRILDWMQQATLCYQQFLWQGCEWDVLSSHLNNQFQTDGSLFLEVQWMPRPLDLELKGERQNFRSSTYSTYALLYRAGMKTGSSKKTVLYNLASRTLIYTKKSIEILMCQWQIYTFVCLLVRKRAK